MHSPPKITLMIRLAPKGATFRKYNAPLAYVAETESRVQFVFLLTNAQLAGGLSLVVSMKDERGVHRAHVGLVQGSLQATIGLTADQLTGTQ